MNDDITTRLRRDCMSLIADEAADTIEQLRADVMCLKYQNAEFVRNLTMAQDERNAATAERDEARADAERWQADALRLLQERNAAQKERDEARRMFCKCHAQAEAIGYAEGRGWDCFKEDNK